MHYILYIYADISGRFSKKCPRRFVQGCGSLGRDKIHSVALPLNGGVFLPGGDSCSLDINVHSLQWCFSLGAPQGFVKLAYPTIESGALTSFSLDDHIKKK